MLLETSTSLGLLTPTGSPDGVIARGAAAATPRRSKPLDPRADLPGRLAALTTMERGDLILEWRRQFRVNPPDRIRRDLLELGIAWKLQEKALGGLKKAVATELRQLAEALAITGDIRRAKPTRLKPGARLVREWGGVTHEVTVVDGGFLWKGEVRKSLSAIAEEITGAHWSGPRFFGLTSRAKTVVDATDTSAEADADNGESDDA
jgi:hypothetical protein